MMESVLATRAAAILALMAPACLVVSLSGHSAKIGICRPSRIAVTTRIKSDVFGDEINLLDLQELRVCQQCSDTTHALTILRIVSQIGQQQRQFLM